MFVLVNNNEFNLLLNNINFFDFFNCVIIFLIFYTLSGLVSKYGEKRILAFFIYFELIQLLIVTILLFGIFCYPQKTPVFLTTALFILGSCGTETAIFLALFMRYFRLTGVTTFMHDKNKVFKLKDIVSVKFFP